MAAMWIPKRLVEVGLINTACERPAKFVLHCEIEYESRVSAAAKEIKSSNCKVIMLTGPSASGKTTTSNKLAEKLTKHGVPTVVMSLDNFYRDIDKYPHLPDGSKDYENIHALDVDEIQKCLFEIVENGKTLIPNFDFATEQRTNEKTEIDAKGGMVVVEGIHALNPLLTDVLPEGSVFKVYAGLREEYSHKGQRFLPTRDIRLARRMVRDNKFRGHSLEKTFLMWPQVCVGEDLYVKLFKPHADLLLDTSFSYEISTLAPFVTEMKGLLAGNQFGEQLDDLATRFSRVSTLSDKYIPPTSMLREFIG